MSVNFKAISGQKLCGVCVGLICWLANGSAALAGVGERFLHVLNRSEMGRAEKIFLAHQNEACKALEKFLVSQTRSTAVCRSAVKALQPHLKNKALREIEAADIDALTLVYSAKERGWQELSRGNLAATQKHFYQALDLARSYGLRWQQQHLLFLIGYTLVDRSRLAEAANRLQQAWAVRSPDAPTHLDGMIHENLGMVAQKQGMFYQALKYYHAALELHSAIDYSEGVATAANNLAELHKECGNLQAALTFYRRCLDALPERHANFPIVQNNVAECLLALKRTTEAGKLLEMHLPAGSAAYFQRLTLRQNYFRALQQHRAAAELSRNGLHEALRVRNAEFLSDAVSDRLASIDSAAEASNLLGQVAPLLPPRHPGQWRMQHSLAEINMAEKKYRAAGAAARHAFDLLTDQSSNADFEFNFSSRLLEVGRTWTLSLVQQKRWHSALLVWELSKSRARHEPPADIAGMQKTLSGSCAVIDFCFTRDQIMAWIIRRDSIDFVPLSCLPEDCLPHIDNLLKSMGATSNLLAPKYDRHASRELFRSLIRPLEKHLAGADCWTLLPDGQMHAIPFEILESDGGQPLLESASLRYWPTLRFPSDTHDSLKTFAAWMESSSWDGSFLPSGTKFARDWEEAKSLKRDILHYAGHSLLNQTFPALSVLHSREAITARQIARARLPYRLVVLSSCESAGEVSGYGSGLVGLATAFQAAGARQIIATLWPIDRHSSRILEDFYRLPLVESELASNFRRARLKFRDKSFRVRTHLVSMANPYFWGPYVLIAPHYPHISQTRYGAGDLLCLLVPLLAVSGRSVHSWRKKRRGRRASVELRVSSVE